MLMVMNAAGAELRVRVPLHECTGRSDRHGQSLPAGTARNEGANVQTKLLPAPLHTSSLPLTTRTSQFLRSGAHSALATNSCQYGTSPKPFLCLATILPLCGRI